LEDLLLLLVMLFLLLLLKPIRVLHVGVTRWTGNTAFARTTVKDIIDIVTYVGDHFLQFLF
jgi:hypothetical protein